MLIETNPVNWNHKIVWVNPGGEIFPAKLISKNMKGGAHTTMFYGILVKNLEEKEQFFYTDGTGRIIDADKWARRIYNLANGRKKNFSTEPLPLKEIKGLGIF